MSLYVDVCVCKSPFVYEWRKEGGWVVNTGKRDDACVCERRKFLKLRWRFAFSRRPVHFGLCFGVYNASLYSLRWYVYRFPMITTKVSSLLFRDFISSVIQACALCM